MKKSSANLNIATQNILSSPPDKNRPSGRFLLIFRLKSKLSFVKKLPTKIKNFLVHETDCLFFNFCYAENVITAPMEFELRKLGLTEKEVRVYLAGLELGPSSVQKIAEVAKITRPTAYEIIKKLERKGLFAEAAQNKKRHFSAQSPEKILGILRIQKKEIEEKEREFIRIIAALETKYLKEKDRVEVFKGREGLKSLEEMISFSSTPDIIIVNPKSLPAGFKRKGKIYQEIKKRLGRLEIKEINSKISGSLIIFDKVALFPADKKEAFLLEP